MTIEIIGILPHRYYSEIYARPLSEFDLELIENGARAHEAAGYDRVLIANSATYPDSMPIATWVAARTTRLKLMIAHRPGFIAPTMAARMFATIDRLSGGRCGVHIITGTSDEEMKADGDYLTKDERYARSREYVAVMKRIWASREPVDHEEGFFKFEHGFAAVKPVQRPGITVFWGGASPAAVENGGQVADVFALPGAAEDKVHNLIGAVRDVAARHERSIDFLLSTRVIIGRSEEEAWRKAEAHLRDLVEEKEASGGLERKSGESRQEAVDRAVAEASKGSRQNLVWSAFGKVAIGRPIANCMVGTVDQLVDALARFHANGVSRFILAGYNPVDYPEEFGCELLPRLRERTSRQAVPPMAQLARAG